MPDQDQSEVEDIAEESGLVKEPTVQRWAEEHDVRPCVMFDAALKAAPAPT